MHLLEYRDYRDFLRDELESRCRTNARYSLRAFARHLTIAPSRLSEVLNRKRGLTPAIAARICTKLGMGSEESSYFCDLVQKDDSRNEAVRDLAKIRLLKYGVREDFDILKADVFQAISEWYHYAILELTFVKGFESTPDRISQELRISVNRAQSAVERLLRLGLLEVVEGKYRKISARVTTTADTPSDAIKSFTKQIIEKALEALSFQNVDERDFGTMTMAVDPTKLPEAKERIKRFRRELCEFMETGSRTDVYCFSSQLFRLSRGGA